MAKLTEKQKRFADEYLIDLNATQSAIRAGYSKKSASRIAIELLNKTHVSQYLIKCMANREQRTLITQDKVLNEMAHIAFDDIKNYLSFRTEKTVAGYNDDGTPIFEYKHVIEIKDSNQVDARNISQISLSKDGELKFKLYPKDNALVQLAKHLGLFRDEEALELKRQELDLKGW